MLKRLPDWYRIVNPAPSDSAIQQHEAAATALLSRLAANDLRVSCTELAALGLGATPNSAQLKAVRAATECIRAQHPAFSEDYEQTALELRVCASTAIGEYISRALTSDDDDDGPAIAAALVLSGLETRPLPDERYVWQMLNEILDLARELLSRKAAAIRQRDALPPPSSGPTDLATALKAISSLHAFMDELQAQAKADREELNVLWWIFGGYSNTARRPLDTLDLGARALAVGAELANLVLIPPPTNTEHLISVALRSISTASSVRVLADAWKPEFLKLLSAPSESVAVLVKNHAGLLPLSWLAQRLLDSGNAPGWEQEFETKTRIGSGDEKPLLQWSLQVFRERIAQRLLAVLKE